jgi:hypothetical protein
MRTINAYSGMRLIAQIPRICERGEIILMATESRPTTHVFLSYAQQDQGLKQELENHLAALLQSGQITWCGEHEIQPGTDWTQEIDPRISTADLILLLISSDLLGSGYCSGAEVRQALERHASGKARLIPIILRYVDFEGLPLSTLQRLPRTGKPVVTWKDRDEAWWDVAQAIRYATQRLHH